MTSRLPRTFNNLKNRCYTTKTIAINVAFAKHVGWLTEKALNVCEWAIPVYLVGIPVCTLAGIATGAYVGGCEEYRNPSTTAIFRGASTSGIKGALVGLGIGITSPILVPVMAVSLPVYYLSSVILKENLKIEGNFSRRRPPVDYD